MPNLPEPIKWLSGLACWKMPAPVLSPTLFSVDLVGDHTAPDDISYDETDVLFSVNNAAAKVGALSYHDKKVWPSLRSWGLAIEEQCHEHLKQALDRNRLWVDHATLRGIAGRVGHI